MALTPFRYPETPFLRMRLFATLLLVFMAGVFLTANYFADVHPAIPYLRKPLPKRRWLAGIADWFAVTALFRHPLEACRSRIPRSSRATRTASAIRWPASCVTISSCRMLWRGAWGGSISRGRQGGSLRGPRWAWRGGSGRARRGWCDMLEAMDEERLGGMAKGCAEEPPGCAQPCAADRAGAGAAMREGRHEAVIDTGIGWAARMLDSQADLIRGMVSQRAGKILRWTGLDETLANAILDGLMKLFTEMAEEREHPVRLRALEGLQALAHRLQHDPEMQAKVARVRDEIIANPAMQRWIDGLWEQARAALLKAARDPQAVMAGKFGEVLRSIGASMESDPALKTVINRFARRTAVGLTASYGDGIVKLVSETVRGWDAQTVTDRLEGAVGRDLQYIRVNGTLVGGMVGVAIHVVDVVM
jgi:uncharacterized membrane-anchored protein YjiN (DUF445 family)